MGEKKERKRGKKSNLLIQSNLTLIPTKKKKYSRTLKKQQLLLRRQNLQLVTPVKEDKNITMFQAILKVVNIQDSFLLQQIVHNTQTRF